MTMRSAYALVAGACVAAVTVVAWVAVNSVSVSETSSGESDASVDDTRVVFGRARMDEASLRQSALRLPEPEYPTSSIANGASGVAVASIVIDTDGSVETVTVLESPDADIGAAVAAALRDALFRPFDREGTPLKVDVTFTYDFRVGESGAEVVSPAATRGRRNDGRAVPTVPSGDQ